MSIKPRLSGIPTPGKGSAIPTPGRSRASSRATQNVPPTPDADFVYHAFANALKANDPARHRTNGIGTSDISSSSLSPPSSSFSLPSGRHSVSGRPSSANSASSAEPPTALQTVRSPAITRHSDVPRRSASRSGKAFEIGDNVRIESLGFEGVLKYVGEIDGKVGLWAGVELSGGFAGKGKNNGSVNQKQYFTCPPNCGVFVATTKLSPPTVGQGAVHRPSSVASSRSGRITPSTSGRLTPSLSTSFSSSLATSRSNGLMTPTTSGRLTPSVSYGSILPGPTPGRSRPAVVPKLAPSQRNNSNLLTNKITAGSRASKYVSMTAKQLKSRSPGGNMTPPRKTHDNEASGQRSHVPSSPSHTPASPFTTPKPTISGRVTNIGVEGISTPLPKGRTPSNTPRARIPSSVAMPPPPSPSRLTSFKARGAEFSPLLTEADSYLSGLEETNKSATSLNSAAIEKQQAHIDRLQSRLDALEYENDRLRSAAVDSDASTLNDAQVEREQSLMTRISDLEAQLQTAESSFNERDSTIESLRGSISDLQRRKEEEERHAADLATRLSEKSASTERLNKIIEVKDVAERELESILKSKNADVAVLEGQVNNLNAQLEAERKELEGQINELRMAGQETIALYEERLSEADGQRFDLEDRIASLETRLRKALEPSQTASPRVSSNAAQIDNESLRDQILHLQKKISGLEDALDDVQNASEKEGLALRERLKRAKEKEDAMRKELFEGRKDLDRMVKLEDSARTRVQEIEEALRESTMALENARAEVEGMRTELSNLDGVLADGKTGDIPSRLAEIVQRASTERSRFTAEIAKLNDLLEASRRAEKRATEKLRSGMYEGHMTADLRGTMKGTDTLGSESLVQERSPVLDLCSSLADQSAELHSLKKKLNRDVPVSSSPEATKTLNGSPVSTKYDYTALRDEITGLKHIVQELQKENLAANQANRHLESENNLLMSETDQLRQELKILEDNIDQSILHEEQAVNSENVVISPKDAGSLQKIPKEQSARSEAELEQLRKRLVESERQCARLKLDLNKEISELETLVESKIYREDELEQELERTKEKLARYQKKASKSSVQPAETLNQVPLTSEGNSSFRDPSGSQPGAVCEICERPGHDIFTCDLLQEGPPVIAKSSHHKSSTDLFCEDCESHGHTAANCPHSLDVF